MNIAATSPLLHVCCAPCSAPIIERLLADGNTPTIFFFNPNIYPTQEYEYRKSSVVAFVRKLGLRLIDADYDTINWFERVKGLDNEPERGRRCSVCFDIRLERTALYAHENGFQYFATTNGFARQKNLEQVNRSGLLAATHHPGLTFLAINWRNNGGLQKISLIAKRERFYKQEYCGCIFSLQKRNAQRESQGLPPIQHGTTYYISDTRR